MAGQLSRADHGIFPDGFALFALKDSFQAETLSANVTLTDAYPFCTKFDANGSHRDVTLDAESTAKEGLWRLVVNSSSGATNLVCKDADTNTIGTVNQNEAGLFYNSGTAWTLVFVFTIALS